MPQLQLAFTKKIELRNQLWIAKSELRKILQDNHQYNVAMEQMGTLRLKVRQILMDTKKAYPKLADDIDRLIIEQKQQDELVSDIAVNDYIDQKNIVLEDPRSPEDYQWEPVLKIKYKKVKKAQ